MFVPHTHLIHVCADVLHSLFTHSSFFLFRFTSLSLFLSLPTLSTQRERERERERERDIHWMFASLSLPIIRFPRFLLDYLISKSPKSQSHTSWFLTSLHWLSFSFSGERNAERMRRFRIGEGSDTVLSEKRRASHLTLVDTDNGSDDRTIHQTILPKETRTGNGWITENSRRERERERESKVKGENKRGWSEPSQRLTLWETDSEPDEGKKERGSEVKEGRVHSSVLSSTEKSVHKATNMDQEWKMCLTVTSNWLILTLNLYGLSPLLFSLEPDSTSFSQNNVLHHTSQLLE